MENKCLICCKTLSGKQTKYCSTKCKSQQTNHKHKNYVIQQKRGYERKVLLLNLKGNCCEICGYNKNHSALCFHHKNPETKSFQLDLPHCSNTSWDKLLLEVEKCQLLCLNCHAEFHNPNFST